MWELNKLNQYSNFIYNLPYRDCDKKIRKVYDDDCIYRPTHYLGFYKIYKNPELLNIIYLFRQIYIINNEVYNLLSILSKLDKDLLKLIIILEQEFENLLLIDYFRLEIESVTNIDNNKKYKINSIQDYIKLKLEWICKKDKKLQNKLKVLYNIYSEDFNSSNKSNIIEYVLMLCFNLSKSSYFVNTILENISEDLDSFNCLHWVYDKIDADFYSKPHEKCDIEHLNLIADIFKKYKKKEIINKKKEINYYDLFIFNKLDKTKDTYLGYFSELREYSYHILDRNYDEKFNIRMKIVENKYFVSKCSEYKNLKYTYLLYLIDNMDNILRKGRNREFGKDIEELIKRYGEEKNWSHIILSNWGYNCFKPLNEENIQKYKSNNLGKFDNRLLYIPDLFNLNEKEYKRYKDSYLLNIEYKNNIESGALFRFNSDKSYKKMWEQLCKLGIKEKKLKLNELNNELLSNINNSKLIIYSSIDSSESELIYKYLLISLWNIYRNIGIFDEDLNIIREEILWEGIEESLLDSGNIIYVVNNMRKLLMYEYNGKELKLKELTKEGKKRINKLEIKINKLNNRILKKIKNNILDIWGKISEYVKYEKESYKVSKEILWEKENWKRKFSLLKYNKENNYNRLIIDKMYYNPIFIGNLHMLNPYKYENREIEWEKFDYNIYQNPEEQLDYTNIVEISAKNKIKGSSVYVINEFGLYHNLKYKFKYLLTTYLGVAQWDLKIENKKSDRWSFIDKSYTKWCYKDYIKDFLLIKGMFKDINKVMYEENIVMNPNISLKSNDILNKRK